MTVHNWEEITLEDLNPLLSRQCIHAGKMTVARIHLKKGCVVPEHSHANEQVSMVQRGRLRFISAGREIEIAAGQVLEIPPGAPHEVHALEDSLVIDLFAPPREDWRTGADAYLRSPKQ